MGGRYIFYYDCSRLSFDYLIATILLNLTNVILDCSDATVMITQFPH